MAVRWKNKSELIDRNSLDPGRIVDVLEGILTQAQADELFAQICRLSPEEEEAAMNQLRVLAQRLEYVLPAVRTVIDAVDAKTTDSIIQQEIK